ncbi:hypothetical protein FHT02_004258, partial [Sphingomonas xinjiangensis]|nr:hypothetical protein [Sphingomonas xinjiangensis]
KAGQKPVMYCRFPIHHTGALAAAESSLRLLTQAAIEKPPFRFRPMPDTRGAWRASRKLPSIQAGREAENVKFVILGRSEGSHRWRPSQTAPHPYCHQTPNWHSFTMRRLHAYSFAVLVFAACGFAFLWLKARDDLKRLEIEVSHADVYRPYLNLALLRFSHDSGITTEEVSTHFRPLTFEARSEVCTQFRGRVGQLGRDRTYCFSKEDGRLVYVSKK